MIRSWKIIVILAETGNVYRELIRGVGDVNPGEQITSSPGVVIELSIAPRSG